MAGRPPSEDDSTFKRRVGLEIRKRRGKKPVEAVAAIAGVPAPTWYAWEGGRLDLERLPAIAKALRCRVRLLLPDE